MKTLLCISGLLFCFSEIIFSQAPIIQWEKAYGGTYDDEAYSIIQTIDGGFVVAGYTESNNGDVSGNISSGYAMWVIKIDSIGVLQWQKCLGGTSSQIAYDIKETSDSGFIIAGMANAQFNGYDYLIIKTDSDCNIEWQNTFGGSYEETAREVYETADGGYILIGEGSSIDGDMFDNTHGTAYDYWAVKVDSIGNLQWQKAIGGYGHEFATSVIQLSDGRFVLGGTAAGIDHDIQCSIGESDFWIVYLDTAGGIQYQKCIGGTLTDEFQQMQATNDEGYLMVGTTLSNDGDVSGLHGPIADVWLAKADSLGIVEWQTCLGGYSVELGYSLAQTSDHGVLVAGRTNSNDSIITSHGFHDFYVAQTDSIGNIAWQKAFGGSNDDVARSIIQSRDGGYLVAGFTESFNGDVSWSHGVRDFWVVKLAPLGTSSPDENTFTNFSTSFNSTSNNLQLNFHSTGNENIQVQLFDITGRKLHDQMLLASNGFNEKSIHVGQHAIGIYFVKMLTENGSVTKKVLMK